MANSEEIAELRRQLLDERRALAAVIIAAGGRVVVQPRDAIRVPKMTLERFEDERGNMVFRAHPTADA